MRVEDFNITIIKDLKEEVYTAFPTNELFSGLVVQVEDIKDIPKEITKSFGAMLQYAFEEGELTIKNFKL